MRDENDIVMSPLADPVVSAIFANEKVAGLAAESLIRATLNADNPELNIAKIISVTPQRSHIGAFTRGCRVDVEVETINNEIVVFEVELNPSEIIIQRDLLSASRIFTERSFKGDTAREMAAGMPKIIYINILNYNIREDNKDVLQPFRIMYTKPPAVPAAENFSGYSVQLPRITEMQPDFTNGFYCWYFTLYTAHIEKKSVQEVLEMSPQLQEYAQLDAGYRQFCDQYNLVASDPVSRREYHFWFMDKLSEGGTILAAERIGMERGMAKGIEKGMEKERQKAEEEKKDILRGNIRRMTNAGLNDTAIAEMLDLPLAEINEYR
jgi:hypothetical protein